MRDIGSGLMPGPCFGGSHLSGSPTGDNAEGVLDIAPAQERLPQQIDLARAEIDTGAPQPHRFQDRAAGQPGDLDADGSALDHWHLPELGDPRRTVSQPGMQAIP